MDTRLCPELSGTGLPRLRSVAISRRGGRPGEKKPAARGGRSFEARSAGPDRHPAPPAVYWAITAGFVITICEPPVAKNVAICFWISCVVASDVVGSSSEPCDPCENGT